MEITEVRIKLTEDSDDRLQAFCSVTFDNAFVVRDLKIIEGANGPFVAMPSRKLTAHCPSCRSKNHLRAAFCNQCGKRLREERLPRDADGRTKLYADVAHPINPQCREMIQKRVIAEFEAELERAAQPGYVSRYDDDYDVDFGPEADDFEPIRHRAGRPAGPPPDSPPLLPKLPQAANENRLLPPLPDEDFAASRESTTGELGREDRRENDRAESATAESTVRRPLPPQTPPPQSPLQSPSQPPLPPPHRPRESRADRRGRGEFGAGIFE